MKKIIIFILLIIIISTLFGYNRTDKDVIFDEKVNVYFNTNFEDGIVKNEDIAKSIAVITLKSIYNINEKIDLEAKIIENTWYVNSKLKNRHLGGIYIIKINKQNGAVLGISATK